MTGRRMPIAMLLLLVSVSLFGAQKEKPPDATAIAQEKLARAEAFFAAGEYAQARDLIVACTAEYDAKSAYYPGSAIARLFVLDALVAYAFRDEGYADRVDSSLRRGLQIDLYLDIGDPAEIPPYVQNQFGKLKAEELARYSRSTRRSSVGLFCALVLEPTVLRNPSLLQPGISYSFNLNENFALHTELRVPLQAPVWNSIRGMVGLLYYPSFRVEKISTGLSFSYLFGLDELATYTSSVSFGGRMDFLTRSGFGIGGAAELVRVDLVVGSGSPSAPPTYTPVPFLGLMRIVFANITLYAYYAF